MSLVTFVNTDAPPIIVAHGEQDCSVSTQPSQLFVNRLIQQGVEYERIVVPEAAHEEFPVGAGIGNEKLQRFFDKHLRYCQCP